MDKMRLIDANALGIGKAKREAFDNPAYADGWNSAIAIIEQAPTVDAVEVVHGQRLYNAHEVAEILAEAFGDPCACNFNGIDEWLPHKCELLDVCPYPCGVACWNSLPQGLRNAAGRLKDVQIENRPALDIIRRFNFDNVLIYADPPYLLDTRGGKQYRHEMTEQDHLDLLAALLQHKGPVILSGYPSEMYDRELKSWNRIERKSYNQNADPRTEVLWFNFAVGQISMEGI